MGNWKLLTGKWEGNHENCKETGNWKMRRKLEIVKTSMLSRARGKQTLHIILNSAVAAAVPGAAVAVAEAATGVGAAGRVLWQAQLWLPARTPIQCSDASAQPHYAAH